jgi:hypothetical protein
MWTAEWVMVLAVVATNAVGWIAVGLKGMVTRVKAEQSLEARMKRVEDVHVEIPNPLCKQILAGMDERINGIGNGKGIGQVTGKVAALEKNIGDQIAGLNKTFEAGMKGVSDAVGSLDARLQTVEGRMMAGPREGP